MTAPGATCAQSTSIVRLWNVLDVPTSVTEAAIVRISDPEARKELENLKRTLQRATADSSVGRALERVGAKATEDSPDGERERLIAGFVDVRLRDLDPRAANRLLAYVAVIGGVLIMLVPSSGIEADLPAFPGDRTRAPRNGSAELVLEAIVRLPSLGLLATPRLDRLFRRLDSQGRIMSELREHGVRLWVDGTVRDLLDLGAMVSTSVEGVTKGDGDANSRKANILGGRINRITAKPNAMSRRDTNYQSCPIGYGPVWVEQSDGARVPAKGSIELDLRWAETISTGWHLFAAGATYREIAAQLAPLYFPLRDGSGRQLRDAETDARRLQVVWNAFSRKTATLHRTGRWELERSTNAPIRDAGGIPLRRRADGRRAVAVDGALPVHMVDAMPWGVPDEVWDRVFARLDAKQKTSAADNGRRKARMFMGSSPAVWTDGRWMRLKREHTSLQLRAMAGDREPAPPWDRGSTELVAGCGFVDAWNRIGTELLVQVGRAGMGATPVLAAAGTDSDVTRTAREDLDRCRRRIAEARAAAETAALLAQQASVEKLTFAAREHLAAQERYLTVAETEAAREPALVAALESASRQAVDEHVDLAQPAGIAAALMRWDGTHHAGLQIAVRQLGLVESMRASYDSGAAHIHIDAAATLTLLDGRPVTLPLHVEIPNTSNLRETGAEAPAITAAWARGQAIDALAEHYHRTPGWIRKTLRGWLRRHGIDTMATALLDCPVTVTRQAVVATVDPSLLPMPLRASDGARLTTSTLDLLTAPYLGDRGGKWKSWAGYAHAPDRRMLNALRIAGGEMDVAPLSVAAGADPARLTHYTGNRPAVTDAPQTGRRRLKTCPHPDCTGALLTHMLYVPETAAYALICRTCRRLPDVSLADAPLPPEYLTKWEQRHQGDRLATGRTTAESLRLPDVAMAKDGASLLRSPAAADILHVAVNTFSQMRQEGKLPEPVVIDTVALWRQGDIEDLAALRAKGFRFGIKDGLLSPAAAAKLLDVTESQVRTYLKDGLLPYRKAGKGPKARYRIRPEVVARFHPAPGDLLRSISVEQASRTSGISTWVIRGAMDRGELAPALTTTGVRRLLPEVFDEWSAQRAPIMAPSRHVPTIEAGQLRLRDGKLSVSATAGILGLSPKQVRRLADKGIIDDHRATDPRAWRWFEPAEIDRYRTERLRRPHKP